MRNAADSKADKNVNVCASCGIAEGEQEIKLEECDACKLVRYCSDQCREEHREQHRVKCRKRAKKLHDKVLFRQPESSHWGDCPICFLPLPLGTEKSPFYSCCSKTICHGCDYANNMSNGGDNCPFCREPVLEEAFEKRLMKRSKLNDPVALSYMGIKCYLEGDHDAAFEYFTKAAELGDLEAHYELGMMYHEGEGVEKDEEKAVHHYEKAAIGGHPYARCDIAVIEVEKGHAQRAVKHLIIAAKLGDEEAMKGLWDMFKKGRGYITKENLEAVLRSHHAAIDAMKSAQREAAERALQKEKKKKNGRRG